MTRSALYGSTTQETGGHYGYGTVFKIDAGGTFTSLHSFNGVDPSSPSGALALGSDGALYGSTFQGGSSNAGTLFKIDTSGAFTSLHSFASVDGNYPQTALTLGSDGALYGSTSSGGSYGAGTLFKIATDGTFTSLHSFTAAGTVISLVSALALGSDGAPLRANVAETPTTFEFRVEGDRGIYDGDRDGSARNGSGGEGDAATVHRRVQAEGVAGSGASEGSG